jgi:hypothetical protein
MPQAASAHDTFWDFVSLMPESTHMLLWVMSDRAIPRSYRMMQGFGVHTFRFVNAAGKSRFVKFHWNPVAGTHSLAWDEAVKISGADSDFHRRDLWEAIEGGAYPEWELGLQIFTERQADAFSFELTRVQTNAVRRRVVAMLANVDAKLAAGVADRLGLEVPEPLPLAMKRPPAPEVQTSKALSLMARPGELGIKTRRVAVVVAEGVDATSAAAAYAALAEGGALPRFVAPKLGAVPGMGGRTLDAEITLETMPAVLFDAVVLADGPDAATTLANDGHAIEFVKDQFRHCKPILAIGAAATVLEAAGIREGAPGVVRVGASESSAGVQTFTRLLAAHRVFERETDPPVI